MQHDHIDLNVRAVQDGLRIWPLYYQQSRKYRSRRDETIRKAHCLDMQQQGVEEY